MVLPPRHWRRAPEGAFRDLLAALDDRGLGTRQRPEQVRRFAGAFRPRLPITAPTSGQLESRRATRGSRAAADPGGRDRRPAFPEGLRPLPGAVQLPVLPRSRAARPWPRTPGPAGRTCRRTRGPRTGRHARHAWKGDAGPRLDRQRQRRRRVVRRAGKGYYFLTFHGRLAPEWLSRCFEGQLGFSGGTICQLTVPGKGPVLAGTLYESYGKHMDPSQWASLKVHSLFGDMWDCALLIAAISEHDDARLNGQTVTSSGEVRGARVKFTRRYKDQPAAIDCEVQLQASDYARVMSLGPTAGCGPSSGGVGADSVPAHAA